MEVVKLASQTGWSNWRPSLKFVCSVPSLKLTAKLTSVTEAIAEVCVEVAKLASQTGWSNWKPSLRFVQSPGTPYYDLWQPQ